MPKFHEIYEGRQQPFKIRSVAGSTATCNADMVTWDSSGRHVSAVSAGTWDWELVTEPTVDSVLRERGYSIEDNQYEESEVIIRCKNPTKRPLVYMRKDKSPTTVELATAICDLLDRLK